MKATMRYEFDAFGANLQCCLPLHLLLGSNELFFLERHVDQTVDRLGTRFDFTETEDLSKKTAGRRQRNLVTVEVFENVSAKHFACSPAWSPDNCWSEMIRASGTKLTHWQTSKWRLVFGCVCTVTMVTGVSIQMRKAREYSKNNLSKSQLVIFSTRQALSRAVVVNSNMSRGKYLAREGPGSRLSDCHRCACCTE